MGFLLGPGQGTRYSVRGSIITFKALGDDTGGVFSLLEREMPPLVRKTPAHRHNGPEAFYVLEGELEFHVGDDIVYGTAGAFVLVRPRVAHTFGNTSGQPARLLTIHAPAADEYFADMHDLSGLRLKPRRWSKSTRCSDVTVWNPRNRANVAARIRLLAPDTFAPRRLLRPGLSTADMRSSTPIPIRS